MGLQIGFLAFTGVQQLGLTGPYEIFALLPNVEVHIVAAQDRPVVSATGLTLTPTTTFAACPPLTVLCVPGGSGINPLLTDAATLDFIRAQAEDARYLASICTGALLLGAAGLLRGRRATTHWASHDLLEAFGAVPVRDRVVVDDHVVTGAGVTAGIDLALTLVAELVGEDSARAIQLALEYAPNPPFDSGTPERARPQVVANVRERLSASLREREAIVARLARAASDG